MAKLVAEKFLTRTQVATDGLDVRVEQESIGVKAMLPGRVVGSVDAVAVSLHGLHVGELAVPNLVGMLGTFFRVLLNLRLGVDCKQERRPHQPTRPFFGTPAGKGFAGSMS
jgi:hypothetical protein